MNRRQSIVSLVFGSVAGLFAWSRASADIVHDVIEAWNPCFDDKVKKFSENASSYTFEVSRMSRKSHGTNNEWVPQQRYHLNFHRPDFSKQDLLEYVSSIKAPQGSHIADAAVWVFHDYPKQCCGFVVAFQECEGKDREWHIHERWRTDRDTKVVETHCYLGSDFCRFVR